MVGKVVPVTRHPKQEPPTSETSKMEDCFTGRLGFLWRNVNYGRKLKLTSQADQSISYLRALLQLMFKPPA